MRSPHLYDTLRRFCLGAFAVFTQDLESGADLPFAFEEHGSYGRPTLYEYRPLVRGYVEARVDRLYAREDVRAAVADLQREPAARIFARAHEGVTPDEGRALYRSVLVPLLVRTAESCGGFDWDDQAYDRAYAELEESLFGEGHAYGAVAPLVGISCGTSIELGDGIRVRAAATGELAAMWPEATGLLPRDFGREVDRLCVLELERPLKKEDTKRPTRPASSPTPSRRSASPPPRPSPPAPCSSNGSTGARTGSGPCCRSPRLRRPGEPTRLDPSAPPSPRGSGPASRTPTTTRSSATRSTGGSSRSSRTDPFRAEQLRQALDAALGDGQGTLGRRRCAPPRCSARPPTSAPTSSNASASRRPT